MLKKLSFVVLIFFLLTSRGVQAGDDGFPTNVPIWWVIVGVPLSVILSPILLIQKVIETSQYDQETQDYNDNKETWQTLSSGFREMGDLNFALKMAEDYAGDISRFVNSNCTSGIAGDWQDPQSLMKDLLVIETVYKGDHGPTDGGALYNQVAQFVSSQQMPAIQAELDYQQKFHERYESEEAEILQHWDYFARHSDDYDGSHSEVEMAYLCDVGRGHGLWVDYLRVLAAAETEKYSDTKNKNCKPDLKPENLRREFCEVSAM